MRTFLNTRLSSLIIAFLLILAEFPAVAGHDIARPAQFNLREFVKASLNFLSGNTHKANAIITNLEAKKTDMVCVCEIMELENNNVHVSDIAVLAEKTSYGDIAGEYKAAERLVKKEKKQMKSEFYDHIKVNSRIAVATDCVSLYMKLRQETTGLQLYDILDADMRTHK